MTTGPWLYHDVIDATWPAARIVRRAPWTLREGRGGGSRVSAATAQGPVSDSDIAAAETAMRDLGQKPIFMIREGDAAIDALLGARGYRIADPVAIYACRTDALTDQPLPRVTVFSIWEPLAIMREIWAAGGIGPERLAIMERAATRKTGLFARHRERPAGVAYAAVHEGVAMVHALEVLAHQRRQGMGAWIMRAAAFWAADQGAERLTVMCTRENAAANGLYASLGMKVVGQYHYRHPPTETNAT